MRLIDADALPKQKFLEANGNGMYEYVDIVYERDIDNAPTIDVVPLEQYKSMENTCVKLQKSLADVAPVRHGKYIGTEFDGYADGCPVYYEWKCSECGCVFEEEEPTYNYCPNCGAKMDEEVEA